MLTKWIQIPNNGRFLLKTHKMENTMVEILDSDEVSIGSFYFKTIDEGLLATSIDLEEHHRGLGLGHQVILMLNQAGEKVYFPHFFEDELPKENSDLIGFDFPHLMVFEGLANWLELPKQTG